MDDFDKSLKEILKNLEKVPDLFTPAIIDAVERTAEIVADNAMLSTAYVDQTGNLTASIGSSEAITNKAVQVVALDTDKAVSGGPEAFLSQGKVVDAEIVGRDEVAAFAFATMMYAPFVELGTVKMSARPFLFPAHEAAKGDFIKLMQAALKKVLK